MKSTFKYPDHAQLISYTEFDKSSEKQRKIEYGAYQNVEPFTSHPIAIHFSHDRPIPLFKNVTRTVTVSHWESIQVDEFYEVKNEIAKQVGEFGRIDY